MSYPESLNELEQWRDELRRSLSGDALIKAIEARSVQEAERVDILDQFLAQEHAALGSHAAAEAVRGRNPDLEVIRWHDRWREQNLEAPFQLVLIGPTHEFFAKMFGPNLNGIVTIGHWSPLQAKWPKAKPFFDAYTKKTGESPDYLDVPLAYMSCEILAQAVAKVGLDKAKLRNEIATATFDTIDGPVKFDGVSNVSTPTMFLQIQDGKAQIIWPKAEETAPFQKKGPWAN